MGVTERKERERLEMKQRILDAAKDVFIQEGYDKASIRAIAERIEYSPATIYLYFKDKDELFYAVHEFGFARLFEQMHSLLVIENPLERLRQMGIRYLEFAVANPELYDLMFISRAPMVAIHKKYDDDWDCGQQNFVLLQEIIRQCMAEGLMRETDLSVATMSIWSFVHGLASLFIRDRFSVAEKFSDDIPGTMHQSLNLMISLIQTDNSVLSRAEQA